MLCNAAALLYHEARNVRHLVNKGYIDKDPWRVLVSLPVNRDSAWQQVSTLRDKAKRAQTVTKALGVFEQRFRVSISDLRGMFGNKNWRHKRMYGGNAWESIADLTMRLAAAIESDEVVTATNLTSELKAAQHNTGSVAEKLARLEAAIAMGQ